MMDTRKLIVALFFLGMLVLIAASAATNSLTQAAPSTTVNKSPTGGTPEPLALHLQAQNAEPQRQASTCTTLTNARQYILPLANYDTGDVYGFASSPIASRLTGYTTDITVTVNYTAGEGTNELWWKLCPPHTGACELVKAWSFYAGLHGVSGTVSFSDRAFYPVSYIDLYPGMPSYRPDGALNQIGKSPTGLWRLIAYNGDSDPDNNRSYLDSWSMTICTSPSPSVTPLPPFTTATPVNTKTPTPTVTGTRTPTPYKAFAIWDEAVIATAAAAGTIPNNNGLWAGCDPYRPTFGLIPDAPASYSEQFNLGAVPNCANGVDCQIHNLTVCNTTCNDYSVSITGQAWAHGYSSSSVWTAFGQAGSYAYGEYDNGCYVNPTIPACAGANAAACPGGGESGGVISVEATVSPLYANGHFQSMAVGALRAGEIYLCGDLQQPYGGFGYSYSYSALGLSEHLPLYCITPSPTPTATATRTATPAPTCAPGNWGGWFIWKGSLLGGLLP